MIPASSTPPALRAAAPADSVVAVPVRRLLDQLRERLRYLHYSIRTEQAYVHWVRAVVRFQGLRHPALSPLDALLPV